MKKLTEKDFLAQVVRLARLLGWLAYHTHDSRRSAAGFPDLVLVRPGRLLFAELKVRSTLTTDQEAWLAALAAAGAEVFVWTPDQWEQIEEVLR